VLFTEATKSILTHELTHLEKHIDQLKKDTPESHYLNFEMEADQEAIKHTMMGEPIWAKFL